MCTAITYRTQDHYFGRTLDYERSYGEQVTITPRNFPLRFRCLPALERHYALIGMATVADGYPLYYEATNEQGLSMAGLNFPGSADYNPLLEGMENVPPFEFIPWILGQCATLKEARAKLEHLNLADIPFSSRLPLAELHWILCDREGAITVECVQAGLKVYENPVGVLTNNPPFDFQLTNLTNYLNLTAEVPENRFSASLPLKPYGQGMGMLGMPGDLSPVSRFVRAAFAKLNAVSGPGEEESVSQFFHILGTVTHPRGCVRTGDGGHEITIYTCCCNTDRGIYYYTTYENSQITAVDLHREDLEGSALVCYPLVTRQQICWQN